jgi:serpin B
MKNLIFIFASLLLIVSCKDVEPINVIEDAKPITLTVTMQKRVNQDNEFAFDIFKKTSNESNQANVLISPLSISIALGMTLNGATDETKTGIEKALKMSGLTLDNINDYYKVMQTTLPTIDPKTTLNIANSIWYKTGYPVKTEFLTVNKNYFNAEVREMDFSQAWAKDTINNWIARKTNNHIKDMLDQIPADVVMYLINAVYFKGMWKQPFNVKATKETNFTNYLNTQQKVNMMYQKDTFSYFANEKAQYLDMPYGNNAFSMTVILPTQISSINEVLETLDAESWNLTLNKMESEEVMVYLPRFKSKSKFLLNNVLKSMGMARAFEDNDEFRNMANSDLYISRVLHDTAIEVTEEGTVAAAATIVEMTEKAMFNSIFNANRPFIYIIREKSTGVILFIGKTDNIDKF